MLNRVLWLLEQYNILFSLFHIYTVLSFIALYFVNEIISNSTTGASDESLIPDKKPVFGMVIL